MGDTTSEKVEEFLSQRAGDNGYVPGLLVICGLKSRTLRVVQQERRGRSFWSTWKLSEVKLQGRCLVAGQDARGTIWAPRFAVHDAKPTRSLFQQAAECALTLESCNLIFLGSSPSFKDYNYMSGTSP